MDSPLNIPKDLIAASATPLILSILAKGDSYGYAIIRDVAAMSDGALQWEDGMLYPILHRLEKRDLVESYAGHAPNGRKRKYYRLRADGQQELKSQQQLWDRLYGLIRTLSADAASA
ncbi:MAG: helix-turn-helix transcriptional regulator [Pseudomonadota bacterium]